MFIVPKIKFYRRKLSNEKEDEKNRKRNWKIARRIAREERLKEKKKQGPKKRSSGNGLKKNIKHKKLLDFQVAGQRSLKFCKTTPYTREVKKILGSAALKIIPEEIRDKDGIVPQLSIYRDTKNNKIVISCNAFERSDIITTDENGNAVFLPDTKFSNARH